MRIAEWERYIRARLHKAGVDNPDLCSRLLLCHITGLDKIALVLQANNDLGSRLEKPLEDLISRRAQGEPLAYILGKKEFFGIDYYLDRSTLIPRPETELLVELALGHLGKSQIILTDAGCGSGCIGLTLLRERPYWRGILFDKSRDAVRMACKNATILGVKCQIVQADLFSPPLPANSLDLFISNPPYINPADSADVMWESLAFEPHSALFSIKDGMAHLEACCHAAAFCLRPGGYIILEHGMNQAEPVRNMMLATGFGHIEGSKDLAGLDRCTLGCKI